MILFYPLTLNTSFREGGDKVYVSYPNSGHFYIFKGETFSFSLQLYFQYIYKCAMILINGRH